MTISVVLGGTNWYDFATNRGTGDFIRWVQRLDAKRFPLLSHLADDGWVDESAKLEGEIRQAMIALPPHESLKRTLAGLMVNLKLSGRSESVMLTDGLSEIDGDEGDWVIKDQE